MEAIKCELCGSNNLVKKDGVYVCQYCGTQYTIEEARNLLRTAEGGIDVSGSTVKVDNTGFVKKYLENARRAKAKEDWAEVEKYYNMVEQNDPSNIEAIFYSAYGKVMQSLVEVDIYKREAAFKPFINSISIVDDNFDFEKIDDQIGLLKQMSDSIFALTSSNYVYLTKKNGYGIKTYDDSSKTKALLKTANLSFLESLNNIAVKIDKKSALSALIEIYELEIKHYECSNQSNRAADIKLLINELDKSRYTSFSAEEKKRRKEANQKKRQEEKRTAWLKKHVWQIAIPSILAIALIGWFGANAAVKSIFFDTLTSGFWAIDNPNEKEPDHYLTFNKDGEFKHSTGFKSFPAGTYTIDYDNGTITLDFERESDKGDYLCTHTLHFNIQSKTIANDKDWFFNHVNPE